MENVCTVIQIRLGEGGGGGGIPLGGGGGSANREPGSYIYIYMYAYSQRGVIAFQIATTITLSFLTSRSLSSQEPLRIMPPLNSHELGVLAWT